MRSVFRAVGLTLALCLPLAPAVQAKDKVEALECRFAVRSANKGWVPEVLVVARVPGAKNVVISDPILLAFEKGPKEVRLAEETARRLTYKWSVETVIANRQSARMRYVLTLYKADGTAKLTARPGGYSDDFTSNGTCKPLRP